jgi:hypothetical protein
MMDLSQENGGMQRRKDRDSVLREESICLSDPKSWSSCAPQTPLDPMRVSVAL